MPRVQSKLQIFVYIIHMRAYCMYILHTAHACNTHTYMHAHTAYSCIYTHTHTCTYAHTYRHTHTRARTHARAHTHTHTHTHTGCTLIQWFLSTQQPSTLLQSSNPTVVSVIKLIRTILIDGLATTSIKPPVISCPIVDQVLDVSSPLHSIIVM